MEEDAVLVCTHVTTAWASTNNDRYQNDPTPQPNPMQKITRKYKQMKSIPPMRPAMTNAASVSIATESQPVMLEPSPSPPPQFAAHMPLPPLPLQVLHGARYCVPQSYCDLAKPTLSAMQRLPAQHMQAHMPLS